MFLHQALPGPAVAAGQDEPGRRLSRAGGVTESEGSRVEGLGLLRAAFPYQN